MKNNYKLLIILLSFFHAFTYSQILENDEYKRAHLNQNSNFFQIVQVKKNEFKNIDLSKKNNLKAFKQFNRWVDFWKYRVNPDGSFVNPNLAFYNVDILKTNGQIGTTSQNLRSQLSSQNWINVGPQNQDLINSNNYSNYPQMGRLNTFLRIPHPTDSNLDVLFVGAPGGGLWKSIDGGTNWTPKTDFLASIGISDIKMSSSVTHLNYMTKPMYVATGDYDGQHTTSIGILKSTDGGETFSSTGLTFNILEREYIADILVLDDNTVIVGTNKFIKKTTDGGQTWSNVYGDVNDSNAYTFARFSKIGNNIICTTIFGGIIKSSNNGDTWTQAVANTNNQNKHTTYASSDGNFYVQSQDGQIKQFNFSSNTLTNIGTIPAEYQSQFGYNMAILVEPNFIVNGEFNGGHSIDNGANWYRSLNGYWENTNSPGTYNHSDHHRLGFNNISTKEIWSVNDGGLNYINYGSNPTATTKPTITYKSGKVIVTQNYSTSINPSGLGYMVSNQDNDHFSEVNGTWYAAAGGDGIQSAINYNNPNIRYSSGQAKAIIKSDTGFAGQFQGNGVYVEVPNQNAEGFEFPLEMNKTSPTTLYSGGEQGVYKISDNGTSLTATYINSGLPFPNAIATHGASSLFVAKGNVSKFSSNEGGVWTTCGISGLPSQINITSIDFNAQNSNIRYLTIAGYTDGQKVYKSTDGGSTWTNISQGLPNVLINEVLLKQNQTDEIVFAATEIGVYFKVNNQDWVRLGSNLPNVNVKDIDLHYTADKLVAATFGRGLWEINVQNSTLGINEIANTSFELYPNPASEIIKISGLKNNQTVKYRIINMVGGIVKEGTLQNNEINIVGISPNIYIIQIEDGKTLVSEKVIIK